MTTFESELTEGNFTDEGKRSHICITPFRHVLLPKVFGIRMMFAQTAGAWHWDAT